MGRLEDINAKIAAKEKDIQGLRDLVSEIRQARREDTPIVRKFFISKSGDKWDKIYDPACILYRVYDEIQNQSEAREAGHDVQSGGMNYLFNTLSGKFVTSMGGGTVHLGFDRDEGFAERIEKVAAFIRKNPSGGEITDIVLAYQKEKGM